MNTTTKRTQDTEVFTTLENLHFLPDAPAELTEELEDMEIINTTPFGLVNEENVAVMKGRPIKH